MVSIICIKSSSKSLQLPRDHSFCSFTTRCIFPQEWANRAEIPGHVVTMLNNFPHTMHPMAQLSAAANALSTESLFSKAYSDGVKKTEYWQVGCIGV